MIGSEGVRSDQNECQGKAIHPIHIMTVHLYDA
jgi:hypothetical protein